MNRLSLLGCLATLSLAALVGSAEANGRLSSIEAELMAEGTFSSGFNTSGVRGYVGYSGALIGYDNKVLYWGAGGLVGTNFLIDSDVDLESSRTYAGVEFRLGLALVKANAKALQVFVFADWLLAKSSAEDGDGQNYRAGLQFAWTMRGKRSLSTGGSDSEARDDILLLLLPTTLSLHTENSFEHSTPQRYGASFGWSL